MPNRQIWYDPGLIEIFTSVSPSKLFFFYSGDAGLLVAVAFELYHYKQYWLCLVAVMFNVYNCIVMVVTRSHYSDDVLCGLVFSHYIYIQSGHFCDWL